MKQPEDSFTRDLVDEYEATAPTVHHSPVAVHSQPVKLPSFEEPRGTWKSPKPTRPQMAKYLDAASEALERPAVPFAKLFRRAIEQARERLSKDDKRLPGHFWDIDVIVTAEEVSAFANACRAAVSLDTGRVKFKIRRTMYSVRVGIYVPTIGSLIAEARRKNITTLEYVPWRDDFFLPGHEDGAPVLYVPEATWSGIICASELCSSTKPVPAVKSVVVDGHEYVVTGGMYSRSFASCEAWKVSPLEAWPGKTYSYDAIKAEWDAGTLERGDERGLVVSVRRRQVVLASAAHFFDDRR